VNAGSVKRIDSLVQQLEDEFHGGGRDVKLDSQEVHNVAGALKRVLLQIEPPLIPLDILQLLQDAQFGAHPAPAPLVPERIRLFKQALSMVGASRVNIIRHMFAFMRKVASEARHNRMDACNVCRVFSASLLRHPNDLQSALQLASGRLPAIAMTILISDVVVPTAWDSSTCTSLSAERIQEVLAREEAALSVGMCPPHSDIGPGDDAGLSEYYVVGATAGGQQRPRPPGWDEVCDGTDHGESEGIEGWLEPLTRWMPRWPNGLNLGWPQP
jgi:hypothetical protein